MHGPINVKLKTFYAQHVFATRVSILYIIKEKITPTVIFQHQPSANLKSRKCSGKL